VAGHPTIAAMAALARELGVVIPVSFFEQDGPEYYNTVAVLDADGRHLGVYRKSHIPDGPGYQEKFFFKPGNTGFMAFATRYATIGVGICWDQWFPECARAMTLAGADLLFYPTAIGTEPEEPDFDSKRQLAARDDRPRGRQPGRGDRVQPRRRRGRPARRAARSPSTAARSSAITAATSWPSSTGPRPAWRWRRSTSTGCPGAGLDGLLPRPPARAVRAAGEVAAPRALS
jgi:hypothetical protein